MEQLRNSKGKQILLYGTLTILALYFLFQGLADASGFLIPLTTAVILSLLMIPLCRKMEKSFMNRMSSSLVSTFFIFLASIGFFAIMSMQVKTVVDDWPKIKETMAPKIEQVKAFLLEHTPLEQQDIESSEKAAPFLL